MSNYTYSLSVDFDQGLDVDLFFKEIQVEVDNSNLPEKAFRIDLDGDDVIIKFTAPLTSGEESTLTSLVDNHPSNYSPSPEEEGENQDVNIIEIYEEDEEVVFGGSCADIMTRTLEEGTYVCFFDSTCVGKKTKITGDYKFVIDSSVVLSSVRELKINHKNEETYSIHTQARFTVTNSSTLKFCIEIDDESDSIDLFKRNLLIMKVK